MQDLDKKREKIRLWKVKNKERVIIYNKNWALLNVGRKKELDRFSYEKRKSTPEFKKRVYLSGIKYSKSEKGKLKRKEWRKNNLIKVRIIRQNRRTRMKGLNINIVQQVYEDNIKKNGQLTCDLCNKHIIFGQDSLEHFTPLSRGGNNDRLNLGIAHRLCNSKKANKTLQEYQSWL